MVKDPWWLYAYWEIQSHIERQVRSQLRPEEFSGLQTVLRVYDVTGLSDTPSGAVSGTLPPPSAHSWFDVPLSGMASNWYIHTNAPNRAFLVDMGLLTTQGRLLILARSNRVTAPRFGPSDVIDEAWMSADDQYWQLFGLAGSLGSGASGGLKALIERKGYSPGFSPGFFSPSKSQPARSFWFWVDAELIVYGATDPKASVTIQGQPVALRPDGSFSIRMALPDGMQIVPVEATSPDRQETRIITPKVSRQTDRCPAEPCEDPRTDAQSAANSKFVT